MSNSSTAARIATPTIAGLIPISEIMSRDPVCVPREAQLAVVIDLVLRRYIGCVPVIDETGAPIGMITKRDLVERLATECGTDACAGDAMLPLAFTLEEHATVAQVAALMATEDVHHVPVVSRTGRTIGIVSTLDIVRWLARNDGFVGG